MIRTVIQQDWWLIRQSPLYRILLAVFTGCLFLAALNGHRTYQNQLRTHAVIDSTARALPQKLTAQLQAIEANGGQFHGSPFADPRSPYAVGNSYAPRFLVYPLHPLTQWSIGQSDIYPTYYRVTAGKMQSLILNEEIANPQIQFTGYFDMSFVLVYLLPLLIIGFTYNLSAYEQELGTLRMLLAEPVSFQKIIGVKFLFRFLLASIFLWLSLSVTAFFSGIPLNDPTWKQFTLNTWWYALFWFALSWCMNALSRKNSGTTAGLLLGTWLGIVLLIPGIINLVANAKYPMPSRIDLITETREAAAEMSKKSSAVLGKYLQDHPELIKDTAGMNPNDFAIKAFTAVVETEKMIAPLEDSFEVQLRHQQRLAAKFGYLSPALILQASFNKTAATHEDNFIDFRQYVSRFFKFNRDFFTKRIVTQKKFTSAGLGEIPVSGVYKSRIPEQGNRYNYFCLLFLLLVVTGILGFRKGNPVNS